MPRCIPNETFSRYYFATLPSFLVARSATAVRVLAAFWGEIQERTLYNCRNAMRNAPLVLAIEKFPRKHKGCEKSVVRG